MLYYSFSLSYQPVATNLCFMAYDIYVMGLQEVTQLKLIASSIFLTACLHCVSVCHIQFLCQYLVLIWTQATVSLLAFNQMFVVHVLRYEQLGSAGKATVSALRGAMLLEYGYTGNKLGLQFLQKALELDPDYWEWNLYCGKVMGRVRQVEKFGAGEPGQEEVRGIIDTHCLTLWSRVLLQKQHISCHLWKPYVHYHLQRSTSLDFILRHTDSSIKFLSIY